MKAIIPTSLAVVFCTLLSYETASILPSELNEASFTKTSNGDANIKRSGLEFTVQGSNINTKYSEFSSGTFRNKIIMVSSKKIGGLGNGIDNHTNEPFTELFCLDIERNGDISNPLFFSRILNTKHNEGQVSFSPDETVIYYTRSQRENSANYQLYVAYLKPNSHGNWHNERQLTLNSTYSIENPHVSPDGQLLYFSSNKPGGHGGFDLYVADILRDGAIGVPRNLGPIINTDKNEKYPYHNAEDNSFYFASNGHFVYGGYDLFISSQYEQEFQEPRNLGETVNTSYDELALTFISNSKGYFSSNRIGGKGSYDIYSFNVSPIAQTIQGIVVDNETNEPLPDSKVVLLDVNGNELSRQTTGVDAHFSFTIKAFENYKLKIIKPGFEANEFAFEANNIDESIYKQVLKLSAKTDRKTKFKK